MAITKKSDVKFKYVNVIPSTVTAGTFYWKYENGVNQLYFAPTENESDLLRLDNIISGETITLGKGPENDDLNKNKLGFQVITLGNNEQNKDNDNDNKIIGETIVIGKSPENEELNKNNIIGQTLVIGNNENNKDNKDNDNDVISGQMMVSASGDNDKDNDKIKKNRVMNQKFKVGADGNNETNDKNKERPSLAKHMNKIQLVAKAHKVIRKQFKIRRAVFVKVEKDN
jgi:hypothetical protein